MEKENLIIKVGNKKILRYGIIMLRPESYLAFKDLRFKGGIRKTLVDDLTNKQKISLMSFKGESKLNHSCLGVALDREYKQRRLIF